MLGSLPEASVDCCVTSPPYWGLRDYKVAGQIGAERSPEEYVERLLAVFTEVRRVLRPEGTLWLNLGDNFYGSWGNFGGGARSAGKQRLIKHGSQVPNKAWGGHEEDRPAATFKHDSLKAKDLIGIPWRVGVCVAGGGLVAALGHHLEQAQLHAGERARRGVTNTFSC
jgi:site-specific DNA-methyltransferase (adenine-specific)